jgi:hypothetical protein
MIERSYKISRRQRKAGRPGRGKERGQGERLDEGCLMIKVVNGGFLRLA